MQRLYFILICLPGPLGQQKGIAPLVLANKKSRSLRCQKNVWHRFWNVIKRAEYAQDLYGNDATKKISLLCISHVLSTQLERELQKKMSGETLFKK